MPAFYKIDKERQLVMSSASDPLTMADILSHQERLRNDPEFLPHYSQICDFTHITTLKFSADDVRRMAQASIFSKDARRAILVKSDVAFGLARMFEMYRDAAGERGICVFRNLDEALEWVLARKAAS